MANLKELRIRINSVKATQKITSAMKLVAGAKLRRAQEQVQAARPYAERMERMLTLLAARTSSRPPLMEGRAVAEGQSARHLLVVGTADRGLCGGFNANIVREARRHAADLQKQGAEVQFYCLGRKGRDQLRMQYGDKIVSTVEDLTRPQPEFSRADAIASDIIARFESGEFEVCTLFFSKFVSAITQEPTKVNLIPLERAEEATAEATDGATGKTTGKNTDKAQAPRETTSTSQADATGAPEFEPGQEEILSSLAPHNLAVQIWRAILENNASEQGARMTAMDNATRNAGDMIRRLNLVYNRTRQAAVTTELIEIISAKEAL